MKYHLITYGCQMNTADAQEMAQPLEARGLIATADPREADIIMMNTCTVREQAEHKADSNIGRLREWKAADPERILIVAGCAATRWGDSIQKKYPFIDLVSPATKIEQFPEAIAQVLHERWNWSGETRGAFGSIGAGELGGTGASARQRETETTAKAGETFFTNAPLRPSAPAPFQSHDSSPLLPLAPAPLPSSDAWFGDTNTAYVTIMRGCNYTCSYCIVPQVRGREKYRALPEILDEIRFKAAGGQRDVMLLGQTVNSYNYRFGASAQGSEGEMAGSRGEGAQGRLGEGIEDLADAPLRRSAPATHAVQDFADLLRAVDALPEVQSIRFMSPHPRHMKSRVIAAMADSAKVKRHLHLPLQSGSTTLLSRMKRLYTREEYAGIIEQLRAAMPGLKITTDVIVGFPGESDADFADTVSLLEAIRFDGLFAFKYSPRPGTASAEWPDDVPADMKDERLQKILQFSHVDLPA